MPQPLPESTPPPFEWVRPVHQERSQRTLQRILDASEELIGEAGFAQTTIAAIAKAAKVSVGTFYTRFRDKDALFHVLHDKLAEQAILTAEAAVTAVPERTTILEIGRMLVTFVVHVYRVRPRLILDVLTRVQTDPQAAERSERMNRRIARVLGRLLEARAEQLAHRDPYRAADFAMRMVFGALHERALFGGVLEGAVPDDVYIEELAQAFNAYLCHRAPEEP